MHEKTIIGFLVLSLYFVVEIRRHNAVGVIDMVDYSEFR